MKTTVILVCLLVAYSVVSAQPGLGRRPGQCPPIATGEVGICAFTCRLGTSCGSGRICCPTACGGSSCVNPVVNTGVPWWCPPGSPRIQCFVNPCTVMTCPRVPWARCINDNPCERACSGNFYVGRLRVPEWICNSRRD